MSDLVPEHRRTAIENLGAEVVISGKNSDEADHNAREYSNKNKIPLIHPFDDEKIIAGQGTIGLEMFENLPSIDTVIVPTSGGGLIGGIAIALKNHNPDLYKILTQIKVKFKFTDKSVVLEDWSELIKLDEHNKFKQVSYFNLISSKKIVYI